MVGIGLQADLVTVARSNVANIHGVGTIRGADVGGELLVDGRVDSVVGEVDIEAGLIGVDKGPLHIERAGGGNIGALLGLGDLNSTNGDGHGQSRQSECETHGCVLKMQACTKRVIGDDEEGRGKDEGRTVVNK